MAINKRTQVERNEAPRFSPNMIALAEKTKMTVAVNSFVLSINPNYNKGFVR